MQTYDQRVLTAFFRDRADAEEAARDLAEAGIAESAIRMMPGKEPDSVAVAEVGNDRLGLWEALGDFFFPVDDREVYAEGLRRGGYLVTVKAASEQEHAKALDILDDEGTIDIDEWSDSWRTDGWSPASPAVAGKATEEDIGARQAASITEDAFAPVVEERRGLGKRDVDNGSARVRAYVMETPVPEPVNLADENGSVERRSADRPISDADAAFHARTIETEGHRQESLPSQSADADVKVGDKRSGQSQNSQGQSQGGQSQSWRR